MELTESAIKSVLKKSNASVINIKNVSFSNTVKLYFDDPDKSSESENEGIAQMKWVEISIVDKSHNASVLDKSFEDCKVSDFLVHKVVYDHTVLPEDENDLDIHNEGTEQESVVFESPFDEGLEFVVHKVTEHEDELVEKELESGNITSDEIENKAISEVENVVKGLSELSVKNIMKHDKIIAFIDQENFCLPSIQNTMHILANDTVPLSKTDNLTNVLLEKNINRIGLSPPLQELSLEKIVRAHSDNILAELDISPLNSVQETDSDSDLSSEGTMIMMTSEECEKNEQHIKESLLKYQSMKKEKTSTAQFINNIDENSNVPEKEPNDIKPVQNSNCLNSSELKFHSEKSGISFHSNCLKVDSESSYQQLSSLEQNIFDSEVKSPVSKDYGSFSLSEVEMLQSMYKNSFSNHSDISKRDSLGSDDFWDKSLTSIEIPKDVREWKILLNSFEKDVKQKSDYQELEHQETKTQSEIEEEIYFDESDSSDSQGSLSQLDTPNCDELENFVNENTERVERIRKRYVINSKDRIKQQYLPHSPIPRTRPQFGSTAQILQLMQKQSNPPFYTYSGSKNHMSWPCDDVTSDPEIGRNVKHKHSSHVYVSQSLSSDCSSQSSFDSDEHLNSSCDHFSISSCPSILNQERGRPEGASPPRSGADDCSERSYEDSSDGFVYFSMKV